LESDPDSTVEILREFFRAHRAWCEAAQRIDPVSMSDVYFSHRPGEVWHMQRSGLGSDLEPGKSEDPDFVFRFSPGAVSRLETVTGGIAEFAVELFLLIDEADPENRVDLRVVANFSRLQERGYLRLLLDAGPKLAKYGLQRGIFSVSGIHQLIRNATGAAPFSWEI
jgi:hypothetical protein